MTARVVLSPQHDLRLWIMYACHDALINGYRGRENITSQSVTTRTDLASI